jgi:hypothetical protein
MGINLRIKTAYRRIESVMFIVTDGDIESI